MREIYLPNLYRCGHYRATEKIKSTIPYFDQFDIENENELQIFMHMRAMTILENILMFDKVYVDLMDLPIIIDSLYNFDKEITKEIIKKGYISFINIDDILICCSKENYFYKLVATKSPVKQIKTKPQLKNILSHTFQEKNELDDVLDILLANSKKIKDNKFFKDIIHTLDTDLKHKVGYLKELGITSSSGTVILEKDVPFINTLLEYRKNVLISKLLNIDNLYMEDVVEMIRKKMGDRYLSHDNQINELFRIEQIPDIKLMLFTGNLKLEDIFYLKHNKEFKKFNEWVFLNQENDNGIVEAYLNQLKERTRLDSIPMYIGKKIGSSIYIINKVLDIVDVVDYIKGYKANKAAPNIFVDNFKKQYEQVITDTKKQIIIT